jgi:NhaA family Na+:H+ antiporter
MKKYLKPVENFINSSSLGGFLLVFITIIALAWANSPWSSTYFEIWNHQFTVGFNNTVFHLSKPFYLWINDGLMAIFFFYIGLEIKREILAGELTTIKKASLPIFGAIGGILVPVLFFLLLNNNGVGKEGWAIPMATDIAFSLAILQLLGKRVPIGLKVFLTALAIVDDIGAVLVIAIFYSTNIHWDLILFSLIIISILGYIGYKGYYSKYLYFTWGLLVWFLFLKSGIHPTVAGVLLAFTIPAARSTNIDNFFNKINLSISKLKQEKTQLKAENVMDKETFDAALKISKLSKKIKSPMQRIENNLHGWIAYFIMPIFAFANAGVSLTGNVNSESSLIFQIAFAMVFGKVIGISFFTWIAIKLKLSNMPLNVNMSQIIGVGFLGGLGFTMALFITNLAFTDPNLLSASKIGILLGSLIAGILGFIIIKTSINKNKN